MNTKAIIAGMVSGFLGAFVADVHAWSRSTEGSYQWGLAAKRWVAGAITGAIGAVGLTGISA